MDDQERERRKHVAWNSTQPTADPGLRIDCDDNFIRWSEYAQLTACGWEIDHAVPTVLGGPDLDSNLRARHWRTNRSAGGALVGLLSKT